MDTVQITIVAISFILTMLIVALGVQVWYILKEVRISIEKMNKMLEDGGKMTGAVSEGVASVGGLLSGIKAGLSLFSAFRKKEETV